jgi:hypothetical protein
MSMAERVAGERITRDVIALNANSRFGSATIALPSEFGDRDVS